MSVKIKEFFTVERVAGWLAMLVYASIFSAFFCYIRVQAEADGVAKERQRHTELHETMNNLGVREWCSTWEELQHDLNPLQPQD